MFHYIIPRMRAFHTIGVLIAIIGLRFGLTSLHEIIIESNVIAEGSTEKVLSRKQYNRGIIFHKLMFEACMRLSWECFITWSEDSQINSDILDEALEIVSTINSYDNIDDTNFELILSNEKIRRLF